MTPWSRSRPGGPPRLRLPAAVPRSFVSLAILAAALSDSSSPALAQGVFDAIGSQVSKVFDGAQSSVVRVRAQQGDFEADGSGFFIDDKGTVLTAAATLWPPNASFPSKTIAVQVNGSDLPAKLVGLDPRSGLAVLQVFNGTTPFLPLADASEIKTATAVVGVGFPFNLPAAPTFGMITGFDTQYLNHYFATTQLRTSLSISPGQIGGPVLNGRGAVVGILVMAADERKFTYALPSPAIRKILDDLNLHGRVLHGWVGVGIDPKADGKDVRITQLFAGTPASTSGLQPGDVVVRIDKREITRPADVIDASFFAQVGQEMPVVVSRNGQLLTFKFVVGERPDRIPVAEPSPAFNPNVKTVTVSAPSGQ